ncbi:MAG: HeH/LEM domain-containing protein [Planctomycetota bacterium]
MNTIHVIPADGFQVRDHTGALIPAEGAEVQDSPVLQRRLREGLLVVAPKRTPLPTPDKTDDEPLDLKTLTVPELRANLTDRGVDFEATAKKPELVELLTAALVAEAETDDGAED